MYFTRRHQLSAAAPATRTGLLTTYFDAGSRVRLSGAVAYGERIFDVASLPSSRPTARSANARMRIAITSHDLVEVGGGAAHDEPSFSQRTVALMYRRTF